MTDRHDPAALRDLAAEFHALAGGWGVPAAIQYSVDRLPGSSTAHVAYDTSIRLGMLLGDVAVVLDALAERDVRPGSSERSR